MLQQAKQPCLTVPRSYHLLMVHLDTPERHITLTSPGGLTLNAAYLHARTGEIVREVQIPIQGPVTLHLIASGKDAFAGWFYILRWSARFHRYGCSCLEAKGGYCCHMDELERPLVA